MLTAPTWLTVEVLSLICVLNLYTMSFSGIYYTLHNSDSDFSILLILCVVFIVALLLSCCTFYATVKIVVAIARRQIPTVTELQLDTGQQTI